MRRKAFPFTPYLEVTGTGRLGDGTKKIPATARTRPGRRQDASRTPQDVPGRECAHAGKVFLQSR